MEKRSVALATLIVAVIAVVALYCGLNRPPASELGLNAQVLEILREGGCASCHTADPSLPFYAQLPVAGDMVMVDVEKGYRAYDIAPLMTALSEGGDIAPIDVAKVEKVALDKSMPLAKYYLVH